MKALKTFYCQLVIALLILGMPSSARCDEDTSADEFKWALQFSIQENLTLGPFYNGNISFKHLRSEYSALRYGISFHYGYSSDPSHRLSSDISVIYQRYINPDNRAKFYWGVGPLLSFDYHYNYRKNGDYYRETIDRTIGVGVVGLGGIEWFATRTISFHAEYQLNALYRWIERSVEDNPEGGDVVTEKIDRVFVDIGNVSSVRFGISVYF